MAYNTFLCYHSNDIKEANVISECLVNSGFRVFFDKTCIPRGRNFQEALEAGLKESQSIIVLIGPEYTGKWQSQEAYMYNILQLANEKKMDIIPIYLPDSKTIENLEKVPLFLSQYYGIDIEKDLNNPNNLSQIIKAIPRRSFSDSDYERPLLGEQQDLLLRNSVDFYDDNAERYYERWKDELPLGALGAFLQSVLKKGRGKKILDAGCGPGHHASYFASEDNEVIGIDLACNMIDIANKRKVANCTFIHGDIRVLHTIVAERNCFDAIWACGPCVHIAREALEHQLYEFLAALKPGGILGISFQVEAPSVIQEDGRFVERYEQDDVIRRIEAVGFDIVNMNCDKTNKSTTSDGMKLKIWYDVVAIAPVEKKRLGSVISGTQNSTHIKPEQKVPHLTIWPGGMQKEKLSLRMAINRY